MQFEKNCGIGREKRSRIENGYFLVYRWYVVEKSKKTETYIWPCLGRVYPLNLSISLGGGKETNRDSLSRGDRKGKSSSRSPQMVIERRQLVMVKHCSEPRSVIDYLPGMPRLGVT